MRRWLLTDLDPEDLDRAFGLCELCMGFPELGWVSLTELKSVRGPLRLDVELDLNFKAVLRCSYSVKAASMVSTASSKAFVYSWRGVLVTWSTVPCSTTEPREMTATCVARCSTTPRL